MGQRLFLFAVHCLSALVLLPSGSAFNCGTVYRTGSESFFGESEVMFGDGLLERVDRPRPSTHAAWLVDLERELSTLLGDRLTRRMDLECAQELVGSSELVLNG
jgi:hypothetical protein